MVTIMRKVRDIVQKLSRLSSTSISDPFCGGYSYITPSNEMPRAVPVLYPLFGANVIDTVAIGNGFIVGAYEEKKKFTLCAHGVNRTLQLGSCSMNSKFDKKVWTVEDRVVQLRCGRAHVLGLTESGRLFGWGSNNMGQLGISKDSRSLGFTFLNHQGVISVAAGLDNSFLLTDKGSVLSCGWAADGQTGSGTTEILETFTELKIPYPVVKIRSSADSSLALCENGKVYGWGNNEYNQVSQSSELQILKPSEIDLCEPIVDIAAGGSFSLFLRSDGKMFSCGYGPGTGIESDHLLPTPVLVPCSYELTSISAGLDHAAGITSDCQLVRWGRGQHHKLISETDGDITSPEILSELPNRVKDVICGPNKTCVITYDPIKSVSSLGMIEGPYQEEDDDGDVVSRV